MTKKLLAICLAALGFAGIFQATASASEVAANAQPGVVRINQLVVVAGGHRHHRYYHRHHYYRHHYYGRHHHRHYYR